MFVLDGILSLCVSTWSAVVCFHIRRLIVTSLWMDNILLDRCVVCCAFHPWKLGWISIALRFFLSILDIGFPLQILFLHYVCTYGLPILHQLAHSLRSGCGGCLVLWNIFSRLWGVSLTLTLEFLLLLLPPWLGCLGFYLFLVLQISWRVRRVP